MRATGLSVTSEVTTASLPPEVAEAAYGIVQEALTNVLKHADATHAEVVVRTARDAVEVRVRDDGKGADPSGTPGLGIGGMRSRAATLGGELETGSRPPGGYEVRATLPVRAEVPR